MIASVGFSSSKPSGLPASSKWFVNPTVARVVFPLLTLANGTDLFTHPDFNGEVQSYQDPETGSRALGGPPYGPITVKFNQRTGQLDLMQGQLPTLMADPNVSSDWAPYGSKGWKGLFKMQQVRGEEDFSFVANHDYPLTVSGFPVADSLNSDPDGKRASLFNITGLPKPDMDKVCDHRAHSYDLPGRLGPPTELNPAGNHEPGTASHALLLKRYGTSQVNHDWAPSLNAPGIPPAYMTGQAVMDAMALGPAQVLKRALIAAKKAPKTNPIQEAFKRDPKYSTASKTPFGEPRVPYAWTTSTPYARSVKDAMREEPFLTQSPVETPEILAQKAIVRKMTQARLHAVDAKVEKNRKRGTRFLNKFFKEQIDLNPPPPPTTSGLLGAMYQVADARNVIPKMLNINNRQKRPRGEWTVAALRKVSEEGLPERHAALPKMTAISKKGKPRQVVDGKAIVAGIRQSAIDVANNYIADTPQASMAAAIKAVDGIRQLQRAAAV